jgi:hypothetical protein
MIRFTRLVAETGAGNATFDVTRCIATRPPPF